MTLGTSESRTTVRDSDRDRLVTVPRSRVLLALLVTAAAAGTLAGPGSDGTSTVYLWTAP